jgi:hypothetical protein
MNMKKIIKCNAFDPAPGGSAGSINMQPGSSFATQNSAFQNPSKFDSSNYNKYYDSNATGQPDTQQVDQSGSFDKDVEQLFKGKQKPTPDDILCGIQYELQNMVRKDKRIAKEKVIQNMKKHGPKYYTGLGMLNINDKNMDVTPVMQERLNVLNQMIAEKQARQAPMKLNDAIQAILQEKRDMKNAKADYKLTRAVN